MIAEVVEPLPVISCGLISSAGHNLDEIAGTGSSVSPAPPAEPGPDGDEGDWPPISFHHARLDITGELGTKGTRTLDRVTALGLVACKRALAPIGDLEDEQRRVTGVVLGTSTGSIRSSSEYSRQTYVQAKPYLVNPSLFPNSVMNCCAGQIAIWHRLRAVNATLAAGRLSSLQAFRYARNALARGHARRLLVGGVEELCPQSAWAWHHGGCLAVDACLGEGSALFVLEAPGRSRPDRATLGAIAASEVRCPGGRARTSEELAGCIRRALARSGVRPDQVRIVVTDGHSLPALDRLERQGIRGALAASSAQVIDATAIFGECYSANAAFQLATLFAEWARRGPAADEAGLITTVGDDGSSGCLVVLPPLALREQR